MKFSRVTTILLAAVLISGTTVFLWEIRGENPGRAWQAFLINLLFFSALAQAGPVFVAIYYLTEARWGRPVVTLALGLGLFLPISIILFAVLFAAFPYLPTGSSNFPAREAWFHPPFFYARDFIGLALLYSVSLVFLYHFLNNSRSRARLLTATATVVLVLYPIVFSLIGFDLVMALDPRWSSTLFGGYFFMSSFYIGLAGILLGAALMNNISGPKEVIKRAQHWDLAKLMFTICLLTAYFLWSQFLVTWYGNLPEEIGFFARRLKTSGWKPLTWFTLVLVFAVPFLALLSQRAKQSAPILCGVGITVLVGMWLERYLLIAPSLALTPGPQVGWADGITTVTFLAAMALSYGIYLRILVPRWTDSSTRSSRNLEGGPPLSQP